MSRRTSLAALVLVGSAAGPAAAQSALDAIRQEAQAVCMNDAMTLCAEFVPDEDQIMACMQQRRAQLSPPCRQVFDAGMKSARKKRRP